MTHRVALLALVLLAACGGPPPLRQTVPPPPAGTERIAVDYETVQVLDVTLPLYADAEEIYVQVPGGALTRVAGALWADDPSRAMTLDLVDALNGLTGARVAPDPWPFREPAQARLDVRVSEVVADSAGVFVLRGRYFVSAEEEGRGQDRARAFDIRIPLVPEPGSAAIANARAQATLALAREIAAGGLN